MNRKTFLTSTGLALAITFGLASCEKTSQAASSPSTTSPEGATEQVVEQAAETPAAPTPDASGLLPRVAARWDAIAHDDWIQAYDYVTPDLKKHQKLSQFLAGKEDHQYRNPGKPRLVAAEGELAYVDIEVVWTPLHAQIYQAKNVPQEGMTQVLRMIETWSWIDGEWYWQETARRNEFYDAHEDLRPE